MDKTIEVNAKQLAVLFSAIVAKYLTKTDDERNEFIIKNSALFLQVGELIVEEGVNELNDLIEELFDAQTEQVYRVH